MANYARSLSTAEGCRGYGAEKGNKDGARVILLAFSCFLVPMCQDLCRIHPSVDSSVIIGQAGVFEDKTGFMGTFSTRNVCIKLTFFLATTSRSDIILFCSPNNPTGHAPTRLQVEQFVTFAKENGSIIISYSAYAVHISDDSPRSIIVFTCFNGASNISQAGGLVCLSPESFASVHSITKCYKENAKILLDNFSSLGLKVYGDENVPYLWVHFPCSKSWDIFTEILEKTRIITVPGSKFGPVGEELIRISASGQR
ncbi:hypothetical protein DKX38_007714 [Salix brachista]|uniref:Aminotransferase class I/classII large domain-containing protein n=1 Tax=Salix brachista TaxID=2182728 RepID=A0A5N5MNP4_9ROSI|nr:hypothetical protein DKX38_007714 [Salix brachista]